MKKLLVMLLGMMMTPVFAASIENSPIGYWKTIDDVTGKPKAIVQIWEQPDQSLAGRILKIFPRPGHDQKIGRASCRERV